MHESQRKLTISWKREAALVVRRSALRQPKLVYVLLCNKQLPYRRGKSRVAYIGTTRTGVFRVAGSVASKADELLRTHGVNELTAWVLTCRGRKRVRSWLELERAFLYCFRQKYGELPHSNKVGGKRPGNAFNYFSRRSVESVLDKFSS